MKTVLLSTVAAAALAFAGAVSAQNLPDQKAPAPERAPAAQQKAPAEKVAPPMNAGERKAPGNAQIEQRRHETTGASAEEKGELKGKTNADKSQNLDDKAKIDSKSNAASDTKVDSKSKAATDTKVDSKNKAATDTKANDTTKAASDKRGENETTAQGSIASGAKLSTEQRTKIVHVFRQHKVSPVRVNFTVRVGARVPAHVHFYPVPTEVITIYPEWRGYDYILVGDQILILDPRTHEIVAILEA